VFVPPIDTSDLPPERDTGYQCPNRPQRVCVPWSREAQGGCPALDASGCNVCVPIGASRGAYADGECCWTVDHWASWPCGC
jgi:hypothetical protein